MHTGKQCMLKPLRVHCLVALDGQIVLQPMHVKRLMDMHVDARCPAKSSGAETRCAKCAQMR